MTIEFFDHRFERHFSMRPPAAIHGLAQRKMSRGFTRCLPPRANPDTGAFFNAGMRHDRSELTEQELAAITAIAAHEIAESRRLRKAAAAARAEYARIRRNRYLTHPASIPMTSAREEAAPRR
ncbi:hypothetical protein M2282_006011 [Variovorax boronicumulans]|uniref:hypothetical protein n=1 Tax=Variovorax boronicumulans TaxID=436515 RepID=UPI00247565C5|nr:hypothetical protein [Variovorax boronicumulans]MDH6170831.1 hypothetical protein [Variovorax boronicumulans]